MKYRHALITIAVCLACALSASCERETREFRPEAPATEIVQFTPLTDYRIGAPPAGEGSATSAGASSDYEENAYAVSEGKRLFSSFNCSGCHAHGGGDMGPPLMDNRWIYGSQPEQIFSTVVEGRPNGMPSFGSKIPAHQIWQIAAYVRSMSGMIPEDAAPGRDDDIKSKPPENSLKPEQPVGSPPISPETSP